MFKFLILYQTDLHQVGQETIVAASLIYDRITNLITFYTDSGDSVEAYNISRILKIETIGIANGNPTTKE